MPCVRIAACDTARQPPRRSSCQAGRPAPLRYAGRLAWPKNPQCTNIQSGPVDGGQSRCELALQQLSDPPDNPGHIALGISLPALPRPLRFFALQSLGSATSPTLPPLLRSFTMRPLNHPVTDCEPCYARPWFPTNYNSNPIHLV